MKERPHNLTNKQVDVKRAVSREVYSGSVTGCA